jgi:hypothetical protein
LKISYFDHNKTINLGSPLIADSRKVFSDCYVCILTGEYEDHVKVL